MFISFLLFTGVQSTKSKLYGISDEENTRLWKGWVRGLGLYFERQLSSFRSLSSFGTFSLFKEVKKSWSGNWTASSRCEGGVKLYLLTLPYYDW